MRQSPTVRAASSGAPARPGSGRGLSHREPTSTSAASGENNRATMAEGPKVLPAYPVAPSPLFESVFGFEALRHSALKCARGVGRKYGTQNYVLNLLLKTIDLGLQLVSGAYREGKTHFVPIRRPKPRTALAISFRDRVVQRSLNDVALYPQVTRGFIWSNFACQKGKGTDAARDYYSRILHNAWLKWRTNKFKIIEFDVKGYYSSMRHSETERIFAKRCDPWTADTASRTLRKQYCGEVGYNPGSQMVQIAGISYLDGIDHFIKETLRERFYLHYMDDGRIVVAPDADVEGLLKELAARFEAIGLRLHRDKTRVVTADQGGMFLGFRYRVTETGRVLRLRDPACVKATRRQYRRLAGKIRKGEAEVDDLRRSYGSARTFMCKGTNRRLVRRMDRFVEQLIKEAEQCQAK